jgi:hypothetical protein
VHQRLGVRVFKQTRNVQVYLRNPPPPPLPHHYCHIFRNPTCPTNGYWLLKARGLGEFIFLQEKTHHSLFLYVTYLLSHMGQCRGPAVFSLSLILWPFIVCVQGSGCTSTKQLTPQKSFNVQRRFVKEGNECRPLIEKNTCLGWPLPPPLCPTSSQG